MLEALALCLATDGDSLNCQGERIRIVGIDAPEMPGSARCNRPATGQNPPMCDHAAAKRSRDALRTFIASGDVRIARCGVDRYGRVLAAVSVDGRDAGEWLVSRGLARRWVGRTGC